jgi:hypothetical protein
MDQRRNEWLGADEKKRGRLPVNWVQEALKLVLDPIGETAEIVEDVKKIVAKMTPEQVAEFKQRIREINEAPQ